MGEVKVVLVAVAVAALALAGSAAALRMDATYGGGPPVAVETDDPPPTTTTTTETTDTTPTTPDVCPSTAVSQDPNPLCPDEPYAADDQGNPVPCNYYSGVPAYPCPHANSTYYIVLCTGPDKDGDPDMIYDAMREGSTPGVDDPDTLCPGGYTVLDR